MQGVPAGRGLQRGILGGRSAPAGPVLIYYVLGGPTLSNTLISSTPASYGKLNKFSDIDDHSQKYVGFATDYGEHKYITNAGYANHHYVIPVGYSQHHHVIPVGYSQHHHVTPAGYTKHHLLPFGKAEHSEHNLFPALNGEQLSISSDNGEHNLKHADYREHHLVPASFGEHNLHSELCDHSQNSANIGEHHKIPADNEEHQLTLADIVEKLTSADSEELISPADSEEHHFNTADNEDHHLTLADKVENLISTEYGEHQIIPADVDEHPETYVQKGAKLSVPFYADDRHVSSAGLFDRRSPAGYGGGRVNYIYFGGNHFPFLSPSHPPRRHLVYITI